MASLASEAEFSVWPGGADVPLAQQSLLLQVASGAVRAYCGWSISAETASFSGWVRGGSLWLPTLLLTDVSSVSVDGVVLVPVSGFSWTPDGRVDLLAWVWRRSPVSVAYTHGYSIVPDAVKGAVLGLASRLALSQGGSLVRSRSEQVGEVSETTVYAVPSSGGGSLLSDADRLALDPFRLMGVA